MILGVLFSFIIAEDKKKTPPVGIFTSPYRIPFRVIILIFFLFAVPVDTRFLVT